MIAKCTHKMLLHFSSALAVSSEGFMWDVADTMRDSTTAMWDVIAAVWDIIVSM